MPAPSSALPAGARPPFPFETHRWTALGRCGSGEGGRKGHSLPGWALFSGPFVVGEKVHVERKSNSQSFHAEVAGPVCGADAGARAGLQPVRLLDGSGTEVHVEPRLARCGPREPGRGCGQSQRSPQLVPPALSSDTESMFTLLGIATVLVRPTCMYAYVYASRPEFVANIVAAGLAMRRSMQPFRQRARRPSARHSCRSGKDWR